MEITWKEIVTFKDIFNLVKTLEKEEFTKLLDMKSDGKDILETILRLFAFCGTLSDKKIKSCSGNFNLGTIKREENIGNLFYEIKNNNIVLKKVKDNGDSSDLTLIDDSGNIIAFTSKNLNEKNMKFDNFDIGKLSMYANNYKVKVKLGICCRSKKEFKDMISKLKKTTIEPIKNWIETAVIVDKGILIQRYDNFIHKFKHLSFEDMINQGSETERNSIVFRPHQEYAINKTLYVIRKYQEDRKHCNVLWGHIARSGKTYMMFGVIEKIFQKCNAENREKMNICIVTTAPNETIQQYLYIMKNLNRNATGNVNIVTDINQEINTKYNLFILSKQLIAHKENKNKCINLFNSKNYKISLLIGDEIHHGGSTTISKDVFKKCFKNCSKIFVTATFNKVKYNFNIHETINWSLEDVQIIKTSHLGMIYPDAEQFSNNLSSPEYNLYPKLSIIGVDNFKHKDVKLVLNSMDKTEMIKMMNYTFNYIIFRLNEQNININQRLILNTKNNRVPVIIIFLPGFNISKTSKLVKNALNEVKPDAEVCLCNTTDSNISFKEEIVHAQRKVINQGGSCVVALTGTQGHLGVSVEDCDLVILMNDSNSLDFTFQSMFRCMTESKHGDKQIGYVIDFNLTRSIFSIIEYSESMKNKDKSGDEIVKDMITNNVFDFKFSSNLDMSNRDEMFQTFQNYYNSIKIDRIDYSMNKFNNIDNELVNNISLDMLNKIKSLKTHIKDNKKNKDLVFKDVNNEETVKKDTAGGSNSNGNGKNEIVKANELTEFVSSIKYLTPICCLLSLDKNGRKNMKLIDMLIHIQSVEEYNYILISQFSNWCGRSISTMDVDNLVQTIDELSIEDESFKKQLDEISSTIKLLFLEAKETGKELSKLIEKHLTPSVLEKKKSAEVSTPDKLCKEMLKPLEDELKRVFKDSNGKINKIFKVFEPCCGKGIFLINILTFLENNSTLSKKEILEECIYFADINPLNIFICKMLLDPDNEYKLNYSLGNTLELDIKSKWGLEGFDAVVGNPPYNSSSGIATGNTIWQEFVKKGINNWVLPKGYMLYVHPCGWRKPEELNSKSRYSGLFDLMAKKNTMIALYIRNSKDGMKTFNCGTRYDWYLLKKEINENSMTFINDEEYNNIEIDLSKRNFLVNSNIKLMDKILSNNCLETLEVLFSNSIYDPRKKYMSYTMSDIFKYRCVKATNKNGTCYAYSSDNTKGHFRVPKVIFGLGGINDCIVDIEGEFGMTQGAMAIKITDEEEAMLIKNGLENEIFKKLMKTSCLWGNYTLEWRLFTYLKKDFYLYLEE